MMMMMMMLEIEQSYTPASALSGIHFYFRDTGLCVHCCCLHYSLGIKSTLISIHKWMNTVWYLCTTESYSTVKKNESRS